MSRVLRQARSDFLGLPSRLRRWWLITYTKLMARITGVDIQIDIHPSVKIERGARFKLTQGNRISIIIEQGTTIEENFHVQFFANSGYEPELHIGPHTLIHRNVSFVVGGRLTLAGMNEIGIGTVIRAAQLIEFGRISGSGEYVSVFDFFHAVDEDKQQMYQANLVSLPVRIGDWVMLAAKSTVNPGTSLSEISMIMPNAVVAGSHGPGQLIGGIPGRPIQDRKPEVFPTRSNPLVEAMLTWDGGSPGPNFKSIDEARDQVPKPQMFEKDKHGYKSMLEHQRLAGQEPGSD